MDRCTCQHGRDHDGSEFGPCEYCERAADAERDSARANLAALQKRIDDADLAQLFDDLIEFLDDQADADGDSEGFYPNKAMRLSSAVSAAARAFGWEA